MSSMVRMPKHEKRAKKRISTILLIKREPRPMVVVKMARNVGNPSRMKHWKEASLGVLHVFWATAYSGKIYMQ